MKHFLLPALLTMVTLHASASEEMFYLGTYTRPTKSKGIYLSSIDTETGRLGPVTLAGEANNPSFLALSPDGKFLYAAIENHGGAAAAFAVGAKGLLTSLNVQSSGGKGACHVWVDATGRNTLVANYSSGSISCIQNKPDGSLGEPSALVPFTGSGPDPKRQTQSYGHSIYSDPANRFVYSCDLGSDSIWIFKFDPEKGALTPTVPASGKVPPGSGPRHLAFHPKANFVYVCNEMGHTVTVFARDPETGALNAIQTIPTLPDGLKAEGVTISVAEICCHPTGKWLYVSNRYHDSFAVYSIGADGKLTWVEETLSPVKTPRGFAVEPSGRWLIAAGQDDDKIAVLKIDQATGKLTATDQSASIGTPVCVLFAPGSSKLSNVPAASALSK